MEKAAKDLDFMEPARLRDKTLHWVKEKDEIRWIADAYYGTATTDSGFFRILNGAKESGVLLQISPEV